MKPWQQPDGTWIVVDSNGMEVAGSFATENEAQNWIKRHTPQPPRFR